MCAIPFLIQPHPGIYPPTLLSSFDPINCCQQHGFGYHCHCHIFFHPPDLCCSSGLLNMKSPVCGRIWIRRILKQINNEIVCHCQAQPPVAKQKEVSGGNPPKSSTPIDCPFIQPNQTKRTSNREIRSWRGRSRVTLYVDRYPSSPPQLIPLKDRETFFGRGLETKIGAQIAQLCSVGRIQVKRRKEFASIVRTSAKCNAPTIYFDYLLLCQRSFVVRPPVNFDVGNGGERWKFRITLTMWW